MYSGAKNKGKEWQCWSVELVVLVFPHVQVPVPDDRQLYHENCGAGGGAGGGGTKLTDSEMPTSGNSKSGDI